MRRRPVASLTLRCAAASRSVTSLLSARSVGRDVAVIVQKASGLGLNARSPRGEIVVADDHAGPRTALRQARASGLSALLCALLPALRRNVPCWGAATWSGRKTFADSTRAAEVLSVHSFCRATSHDACTSYIAWAPDGAISAEQFHTRICPNNAMALSRKEWLWSPNGAGVGVTSSDAGA